MKEQEQTLSHRTYGHAKEQNALYRIYFPVKWKCVGQYSSVRTFTPILPLIYIMVAHIRSTRKYFLKIKFIFSIFLTNKCSFLCIMPILLRLSEPLHHRPVRHIPVGD